MLIIEPATHLELAARRLAVELVREPLPPWQDEVVVVPSGGLQRWLALQLARDAGISAGVRFQLPGRFVADLVDRCLGCAPGDAPDPWSREVLAWRILALGPFLDGPRLGPLARYLAGTGLRQRVQAVRRIAQTLEDYQLFRPDWLRAWEGGRTVPALADNPHAAWQAELWRELGRTSADSPAVPLHHRLTESVRRLRAGEVATDRLPARVSVLGVHVLPPSVLELCAALATRVAVAVRPIVPATGIWLDEVRRGGGGGEGEGETAGNGLLAAWGRQARDQQRLLLDLDRDGAAWRPLPTIAGEPATLLESIQAAVRANQEPGRDQVAQLALAADDRSLTFHRCHARLRECEVARDLVLRALHDLPDLAPGDVLVLAADLPGYLPLLDAVFRGPGADGVRLPVSIADQGLDAGTGLGADLLRLLALVEGRRGASAVLGLLDREPVRRAAGFAADDLPQIQAWVAAAGIHWGRDAADHARHDLPAERRFTWAEGLDRLVLGYATGADADAGLVAGVLPVGGDTAGDPELLGHFAAWADRLLERCDRLLAPRPLVAWAGDIAGIVEEFLDPGEDGWADLGDLTAAIARLGDLAAAAAHAEAVPLAVVLDQLQPWLAEDRHGDGFLAGAVTVCAFTPMRTIPARVVIVVGLDAGTFPRQARPTEFDLVSAVPRPGDRRLADDDRELFLATLLAARDRLAYVWTGHASGDGAMLQPSSCLTELLAWCDRCVDAADGPASIRLVADHPLQPFSPRYGGDDDRLRTFVPVVAAGADRQPAAFISPGSQALLPQVERSAVRIDDLIAFWTNPARAWCRAAGIVLARSEDPLDDDEPMVLDSLSAFAARDRLLAAGPDSDRVRRTLVYGGLLPPGHLGTRLADDLASEIAPLIAACAGVPAPAGAGRIDLDCTGVQLTGDATRWLHEDGLKLARAGAIRPQDRIRAWLLHLAVSASGMAAGGMTAGGMAVRSKVASTRLLGFEKKNLQIEEIPAISGADARALLIPLIARWRDRSDPPPSLFPHGSYAYAKAIADGSDDVGALERAGRLWQSDSFHPGQRDLDDDAIALCWRGRDPYDECADEVADWALVLWGAYFDIIQET